MLDLEQATETLKRIFELWGRPVNLLTIVKEVDEHDIEVAKRRNREPEPEEQGKLIRYNGQTVTTEDVPGRRSNTSLPTMSITTRSPTNGSRKGARDPGSVSSERIGPGAVGQNPYGGVRQCRDTMDGDGCEAVEPRGRGATGVDLPAVLTRLDDQEPAEQRAAVRRIRTTIDDQGRRRRVPRRCRSYGRCSSSPNWIFTTKSPPVSRSWRPTHRRTSRRRPARS